MHGTLKNCIALTGLVAGLAAPALAATPTLDMISADRELFVIACGFDYEFDDCDDARHSTGAATGYYGDTIVADLDDYYGNDIADAWGWLDTNATTTTIYHEVMSDATVSNSGIFSADAGVYADGDYEFEFLDDVRVKLTGYVESYYPSYFDAGASLREVGGLYLASFGVIEEGDSDLEFTDWLYAGTYQLNTHYDASGRYGMPSAGEMLVILKVYHKTDFNTNGTTDNSDLSAYVNAYVAGSSAADYNGDGVTNTTDLSSYVSDWSAESGS